MIIVSRPKKRLFIVLISLAALLMGGAAYGLWHIMVPGLAALHPALPLVVGLAVLFLALSLFVGIGGIVLAILGFPTIRFFYFWAWNVINLIYPIAIFLGEMMHISKMRIEQSFIEVSNHLVRRQHIKVPADRLMILTPHCLQLDTCPYKVTRDIHNCHQCGRCGVGDLLHLSQKYGVHVYIVTGGTLARQAVKKVRPKAILAVACERDLTSGIQDVFPMPVIGVLNRRPNGPCFNTSVDIDAIEEEIKTTKETVATMKLAREDMRKFISSFEEGESLEEDYLAEESGADSGKGEKNQ